MRSEIIHSQRLPRALLVGGMKCGSSSLFSDLIQHPDVFNALVKEPSFLKEPNWSAVQIVGAYRQLYKDALDTDFIIDGSTRYSMRNDRVNPAKRAAQILPENTKIIYIIREPVSRIVSHFRHAVDGADMVDNFEVALRQDKRLIDYTRYYHQLEPWLDVFGRKNVFVFTLDAYVEARQMIYAQLLAFLGLSPATLADSIAANRAEGRVVLPKYLSKILRVLSSPRYSTIYQNPAVICMRRIGKKIIPKNNDRVPAFSPTASDLSYIWENLVEDLKRIAPLCQGNLINSKTVWDAPTVQILDN